MDLKFKELEGYLKQEGASTLAWKGILSVGLVHILYIGGLVIYRLAFHPLARFPGPFLCRISYLQQCYYEAILNGKFLERLPYYHRQYGTFGCLSLLGRYRIHIRRHDI